MESLFLSSSSVIMVVSLVMNDCVESMERLHLVKSAGNISKDIVNSAFSGNLRSNNLINQKAIKRLLV